MNVMILTSKNRFQEEVQSILVLVRLVKID